MDIKEFRAKGLLQEANRLFFHPRGLALEVVVDDDTKEEKLGGIWDYRDDPVGIFYQEGIISWLKICYVKSLFDNKKRARIKACGSIIQTHKNERRKTGKRFWNALYKALGIFENGGVKNDN